MADEFLEALGDDDEHALYEHAPCGYLSMASSGTIVKVNETFLQWTGYRRDELVGQRTLASLLTAGGRIYHETHYSPMLQMGGAVREIALDIVCADASRLPALVNALLVRDEAGNPSVVRAAIFNATDRRNYERQLVQAKLDAEAAESRALTLARTLQQTLIPPALPHISGLDIAAIYRPAGDGTQIGGDFYDVFRIGQHEWAMAIGDVQGKGVDAAVVSSLVRHTIRAAAIEHESPAEVLAVLNTVLFRDDSDRLCTAVVMRMVRRVESWSVTVSVAGHPLPILRRGDDPPTTFGIEGSLLGYFPAGHFHDVAAELVAGDMLVGYTDGVSEARNGHEFFGEAPIEAALRDRALSSEEVTRRLLGEALDFQSSQSGDDIAIVAVGVKERDSTATSSAW